MSDNEHKSYQTCWDRVLLLISCDLEAQLGIAKGWTVTGGSGLEFSGGSFLNASTLLGCGDSHGLSSAGTVDWNLRLGHPGWWASPQAWLSQARMRQCSPEVQCQYLWGVNRSCPGFVSFGILLACFGPLSEVEVVTKITRFNERGIGTPLLSGGRVLQDFVPRSFLKVDSFPLKGRVTKREEDKWP